jgi:hypothetical protein
LARAKNTSRSEARRRTRELTRAEIAAQQEPEDGGEASASTTSTAPARRASLIQMPDVLGDLRALPQMFRTRRLLWVPFAIVLVGFILVLIGNGLPADAQPLISFYIQYFLLPQALFTYFIGGFLATRGSYLVGGLLGFMIGIGWIVVLVLLPEMQAQLATTTDLVSTMGIVLIESVVLGVVFAGFAGWYRDFLRRMQDNSRNRQQQREAEAKQKRAAERQEARRAAKQRTAN